MLERANPSTRSEAAQLLFECSDKKRERCQVAAVTVENSPNLSLAPRAASLSTPAFDLPRCTVHMTRMTSVVREQGYQHRRRRGRCGRGIVGFSRMERVFSPVFRRRVVRGRVFFKIPPRNAAASSTRARSKRGLSHPLYLIVKRVQLTCRFCFSEFPVSVVAVGFLMKRKEREKKDPLSFSLPSQSLSILKRIG